MFVLLLLFSKYVLPDSVCKYLFPATSVSMDENAKLHPVPMSIRESLYVLRWLSNDWEVKALPFQWGL
jgi:hypothetical protein